MIVVDANILLELIEERLRYEKVRDMLADHSEQQLYASTLSISIAFYIAESHKVSPDETERVISYFEAVDVVKADIIWALKHYNGKDFEDALQVAAARHAGAKLFVTLDAELAKKYQKFLSIQVIR